MRAGARMIGTVSRGGSSRGCCQLPGVPRGAGEQLTALDGLVSRLASGMTAGEELLLEDLLSRQQPLLVQDLLAWHHDLPPADAGDSQVDVELVAALLVRCRFRSCPSQPSSSTLTARSSTPSS